jgi:hypothetical protein
LQKALLKLFHPHVTEYGVLRAGIKESHEGGYVMIAIAVFEAGEIQDGDSVGTDQDVLGLKIGMLPHDLQFRLSCPVKIRSELRADPLDKRVGKSQRFTTPD